MARPVTDEMDSPEFVQSQEFLGSRVKQLRTDRDMSQKDLADVCQVGQSYIYEIERGSSNITLKSICRLANALGVQPRDLLMSASASEGELQVLRDSVGRLLRTLKQALEDEQKALGSLLNDPIPPATERRQDR